MTVIAYIGLGSNLDNPLQQLKNGLVAINLLPHTQLLATSDFYWNPPWGDVREQPMFLNAVTQIATSLSPRDLLKALQRIENQQGRIREIRYGPRTLDLDILLYGDTILQEVDLIIPHPELKNRAFVIQPLYELAPNLHLPTQEKLQDIWLSFSEELSPIPKTSVEMEG